MRLLRRVAVVAVVALCVGVVIGYQSNRPAAATPDPVVFVPSPGFYRNFSPSVRATLADVYWLYDHPVLRRASQLRPPARLAARHGAARHRP